jgi:hypothetical protein
VDRAALSEVCCLLPHRPAGNQSFRKRLSHPDPDAEEQMRNASLIVALATVLACAGVSAYAQTPQQQDDRRELAPTSKLNLTLEQRHTIKEFMKDKKAEAASPKAQATVGDPIPVGVNPQPMPADVGQKVPQVKAHRFFLTADEIVIVDPKDNKVAEIIKLAD